MTSTITHMGEPDITLTADTAHQLEVRLNKIPQGNHGPWTGLGNLFYEIGKGQTVRAELCDAHQYEFVRTLGRSWGIKRQKQVDSALDRAFDHKNPVGKCRAVLSEDGRYLTMFHHQHKLLVFDVVEENIMHYWYETETDKRIFNATVTALLERLARPNSSSSNSPTQQLNK